MKTRRKPIIKFGPFELNRRVQVASPPQKRRLPADKEKTLQEANRRRGGRTTEMGVAGNTDYHGWAGGGDYLRSLTGPAGMAKYDEMRRSDAQVTALLQAITLPIRRATWRVEPPKEGTAKDVEIAEIINENLMREMSSTWDEFLRHALLMLPFGFSPIEKVWIVDDDLVKVQKLDARLPWSVQKWDYDKAKRRLMGIVQADTDMKEYYVPIEKLLIFTMNREGDNWEGTSILRPAYKPWFVKNDVEKINAIKHERHGVGVPVITVPAGTSPGTEQWDEAEEMAKSLIAHESSYAIAQEGYKVEILGQGSDAKGTDALPTIKYYDEMIARSALAMFLNLGTTETGSRALGGSFIDVFLASLQATADGVAEVLSRFLIREYVDYNWTVEEYPTMQVSSIRELDATTIKLLKDAGLLTADFDTEQFIRSELRLPEKDEDEWEEAHKTPPALQPGNGSATADANKGPENEDEEAEEEGVEAAERERQVRNLHGATLLVDRELQPEERLVNVATIEMQLNEATADLTQDVLLLRNKQVESLVIQLVGAVPRIRLRIPNSGEMYDAVLSAYKEQVPIGQQQVREEAIRQVPEITLRDPIGFTKKDLLAFAEEELSIMVQGAGDKLASLMSTWSNDLRREGLTGDALEQALRARVRDRLSNATWEGLSAAAVNTGWGAGRDLEIKALADTGQISYCYYSAILDGNTCEECAPKDQARHAPGDALFITPNPDCLGGPRCRCLTVCVLTDEVPGSVDT